LSKRGKSRRLQGGEIMTAPIGRSSRAAPPALQGLILVSVAWLAVMATSLIAPVLPLMARHFADTPNAKELVQLTVALPALMVALFAVPIGLLIDRLDRIRVLIGGLLLYAAAGLAPTLLDTLPAILASRCVVGLAEAVVMTAGTALLADLFDGPSRERWFALQTGSATLVSVVVLALGGALGEVNWRTPFFVYALPSILAVLVWRLVSRPVHLAGASANRETAIAGGWGGLAAPALTTLLASVAFYVVVIQLPFLLTTRGYAAPSQIGVGAALAAAAVPLGSVLFRILAKRGVAARMAVSFALSAVGFLLMAHQTDYAGTLAGAFINGVGSGLALPTLLTWATGGGDAHRRGRSTGAWNTAFFLGQFLSPIVFAMLSLAHGADSALRLLAGACALAFVASLAAHSRRARSIARHALAVEGVSR